MTCPGCGARLGSQLAGGVAALVDGMRQLEDGSYGLTGEARDRVRHGRLPTRARDMTAWGRRLPAHARGVTPPLIGGAVIPRDSRLAELTGAGALPIAIRCPECRTKAWYPSMPEQ